MGKRKSSVLVAAIVVLSACSGSNTTASPPATQADHSSTSALRTVSTATTVHPLPTTTATATTITTTTPPEFSFDDSVPPPRLVNTGKDYVAILKSLLSYGAWLGAHRPNPTSASSIAARGTTLHDLYVRDMTLLRDNATRAIETLGGPSRYTILSTRPDAFSAKVVEKILVQKTVVASGRVTSVVHFTGLTTYLMLAVLVGGHWYLAAADEQRPVNVHL